MRPHPSLSTNSEKHTTSLMPDLQWQYPSSYMLTEQVTECKSNMCIAINFVLLFILCLTTVDSFAFICVYVHVYCYLFLI